MKNIVVAVMMLVLSPATRANVTYAYVGSPFTTITDQVVPVGTYTTAMNITALVTLTDALTSDLSLSLLASEVVSFSFTDGRIVETNRPANSLTLFLGTDAVGNINVWNFDMSYFDADKQVIGRMFSLFFPEGRVPPTEGAFYCDPSADCGRSPLLGVDAAVVDTPQGLWQQIPTPIPLPGAAAPMSLILLGLVRRRRHGSRQVRCLALSPCHFA